MAPSAKYWGMIGLGMLAIGGLVYYRKKGGWSGLGLSFSKQPRLITHRTAEAPVVSTRTKGGMKTALRQSRDMPIEERVATIQRLVHESVQDPEMRKLALSITRNCPERDGRCEAEAIYHYVKKNVRYTGDVAPILFPESGEIEGVDLFQSAQRTLEFGGGDCLPTGTLLLTEKHEFVAIEDLIIGQRIWGRDAWTTVKDVWAKGVQPVDAVHLNNGSTFKATGEHKVYVALCSRHPVEQKCSCHMDERSVERLLVSQLEPGMVLVQPERIAFGTNEMDPKRAYVEGLFLSDGSSAHDQTFEIAGQDGCPKEEQKREVEAICKELGVATTWQRKYIAVKDKEWAHRLQKMGARARFKAADSISWTEPVARQLLRGIMADSGANTSGNGCTFTSTSRTLAMQVRVLQRMIGLSCGERYIVDHGGLGKHPIWRMQVRGNETSPRTHAIKLLRVKEIDRAIMELPTYDISTEDHYVYLPEADVVVSNCDDQSGLSAVLLSLNGIPARLRVMKEDKADDWSHILVVAGLSKTNPTEWVPLDTTLPGNNSFGVQVPYADALDFPA